MRSRRFVPLLAVFASLAGAVLTAQQPEPPRPRALTVAGLDANAPLHVAATLNGLSLQVQVALQPGWHLYGRDTGGGQPVQIEIGAGSAFAAAGALQTPMDAHGLITGDATLTLPLRSLPAGTGCQATMRFVVCDALQCLPPMALELSLPPLVSANAPTILLVAVDDSERTTRIAAFLNERGLQTTTTTYAKVQQADCDRHDVVLADSPTFGQTKGARAAAVKFPMTGTPIVAVGFLGTQLLEAQKVAMACGYI